MKLQAFVISALASILLFNCSTRDNMEIKFTGKADEVRLMTLDPGHFHAALVQKKQYLQVSPKVYIYAPGGNDVEGHLKRINGYNSRDENPTNWESILYTGPDYFEKMISEKPGNVMVTAGNNQKKTEYIKACIDAGINVLADKPMCIDHDDFLMLLQAFEAADKNNVLLYDIMTERSEITTILQKELLSFPEVFGTIVEGSPEDPAIIKSSVHHFFKYVSGSPLIRPAWFFDSSQQGDGLVDVTTHLVDLVQWELFPEIVLDYKSDISINNSRRWPTKLSLTKFSNVTGLDNYPDYLKQNVNDEILDVYSNGEINYKLKGINAKVVVEWKYQAPEGGGDTHFSVVRGTKSNIVIRQGREQNYRPELYIEVDNKDGDLLKDEIKSAITDLSKKYPGVDVEKSDNNWHVIIPDKYRIGHEAHFAQVMERYLKYLVDGKLPEWEVPNMIAKYYTTISALELAQKK
jgi:predicted dehydrogenase